MPELLNSRKQIELSKPNTFFPQGEGEGEGVSKYQTLTFWYISSVDFSEQKLIYHGTKIHNLFPLTVLLKIPTYLLV